MISPSRHADALVEHLLQFLRQRNALHHEGIELQAEVGELRRKRDRQPSGDMEGIDIGDDRRRDSNLDLRQGALAGLAIVLGSPT